MITETPTMCWNDAIDGATHVRRQSSEGSRQLPVRNNGTTQRPVANYTSNTVQRQRQQSPMSTSKIIDDDDINTMTAYGQYYNSTLGR